MTLRMYDSTFRSTKFPISVMSYNELSSSNYNLLKCSPLHPVVGRCVGPENRDRVGSVEPEPITDDIVMEQVSVSGILV